MSDLFTNNPHIKQHDWDKPKEEKKPDSMIVEWIDGHKLDDVTVPEFTTDKDGYVYIDLDTCQ